MKKRTGKSKRAERKRKSHKQKSSGGLRVLSPNPSVVESPDEIKMSEVILNFAEPLLEKHRTNMERVHDILTLAVAAWNMSMLPESSEEQIVSSLASSLPKEFLAEDVAVLLKTIYMLMERRRLHFQNIQRIVINHEIVKSENGWDFTVSSAPAIPKVE